MSTGIDGLDLLVGGGIVKGGTLLLEHDGQASPHSILTNLLARAYEHGMAVTIVPPAELPPKRLRSIIDERIGDMEGLLADDQLFLPDFANIWENTKGNVFSRRNTTPTTPPPCSVPSTTGAATSRCSPSSTSRPNCRS